MPHLFNYHIFISHAWKYGDDYNRLINMLDHAPNFSYYNYSAPQHKPLHNLDSTDVTTQNEIKRAIIRKISSCNCVLVIAGMYYNHRKWMQYEIDIAKQMGKPIIAISPWGSTFIPRAISDAATTTVGWNTNSIVNAIRLMRYYTE